MCQFVGSTEWLCNKRYTVSMAVFPQAIDSATSHFFFNLNDIQTLDHRGPTLTNMAFVSLVK